SASCFVVLPARYAPGRVRFKSRRPSGRARTSVAKLLWGRLDEAKPESGRHGFGARMDFEFLEDGRNVMINRLRREVQAARKLGIGMTVDQQPQQIYLAPRQ